MAEPAADAAPPTVSLPRRLLDYLDWKINPVLLKDLRLFMRGKLMLALYFFVLAILVMMGVLYTVIARFDATDGTGLLALLTPLLLIICGAMIPNLVFERFRSELSNRATELALTSPLTPAELVRGKLIGAWCMTFMVVSAAAPILATAYLLGGVNLLGLLGIVGGVLLAGMTVPMVQLSMAADFKGGKGLSRGLAALMFVLELVLMLGYSSLLQGAFIRTRSYVNDEATAAVLCCVAGAILIAQFLYFNTVGVLRGEAENRDVAPRLSLAAAALLGPVIAYVIYRVFFDLSGRTSGVLGGILCFDIYAFALGFTAVSQSSPTTPRNLQDNWRTKPIRSLFLLPGTRSLTAYFILMSSLLMAALVYFVFRHHGSYMDRWQFLCIAMAPIMADAYGIVIYHHLILPFVKDKRNPKLLSHTTGIANVILAIISVFAMILVSYVWENEGLYAWILGVTPVGLVTIALDSREVAAGAGFFGIITLVLLGFFMLPIIGGRNRTKPPPSWKGPDAQG